MQIRIKDNRPVTTKRIVFQWIITIVLGFFAYAFVSVAFDAATEENTPDYKVMQGDIRHGQYGRVVDYYDTVNHLYGVDEPEYAQYTEFYNFYNDYLLYLEYSKAGNTDKADKYLQNLMKINAQTQYFEMKPHYEYLLGTIDQRGLLEHD